MTAKTLFELRTWAGHSSIVVTADRYGHYYEDVLGSRVSALDDLMRPPAEATVTQLPAIRQRAAGE